MPPEEREGGDTEDAGAPRRSGGGIPSAISMASAWRLPGVKGTLRDSSAATQPSETTSGRHRQTSGASRTYNKAPTPT